MADTGVPEVVRRFIVGHIESVAQLEVLLLLRGAADKRWTLTEVARALTTEVAPARHWLDDLVARDLVSRDGGRYRYSPPPGEVEQTVDALAESFAKYRVAVIAQIFSKPDERITRFADAFRIRRED